MATSETSTKTEQPRTAAGKEAVKSMKPGSESEYLARQADEAKRAMGKAFDEFTHKLGHALSINTAAKDHPWLTVAAGAVAGFAAGAVVTPSKTDSALKRLREIERALRPERVAEPIDDSNGHHAKAAAPGMGQTLLREIFSLARPLVASGISAVLAAKSAATETAEEVQTQQGMPPDGTGHV